MWRRQSCVNQLVSGKSLFIFLHVGTRYRADVLRMLLFYLTWVYHIVITYLFDWFYISLNFVLSVKYLQIDFNLSQSFIIISFIVNVKPSGTLSVKFSCSHLKARWVSANKITYFAYRWTWQNGKAAAGRLALISM